ncbi:Glucose-methanol-choline oxidoreductase C-terminal [Penicillium cf. viridicatum]|uniref:Glucose-methanol-choline oxidoreductase C-terminal n=1 Tax=Penicillium cf. viridicatum TaxID=2972119 RepID=A0A9W9SY73_9EURO|nr:Glucose-methanol-choline oxidoreductase C-terminal [Penicillium cf. viridicatum]
MSVQDNARFNFIIVSGGTAGNVVAGHLAKNPNAKILVIEAGYDWAYKSTIVKREDYERIEKPNTCGKALGGSSSLNYFTWAPGSKGTFDMWEEYGGKEWTWDPLVPYLRKSATYHNDDKAYALDLKRLGLNGPIPISHSELIPEM